MRGMLSGDWGRPLREVTLEQRVDQNSALEDAATGRALEVPGEGLEGAAGAQAQSWEGS